MVVENSKGYLLRAFYKGGLIGKFVFCILIVLVLCSCGISYKVPSATIQIALISADDVDPLRVSIGSYLISRGFEDQGKDEEMLKILEARSSRTDLGSNNWVNFRIEQLNLTQRLSNDKLNLEITIIDYSNVQAKKRHLKYNTEETPVTDGPSLEIGLLNHRPGGFSKNAFSFYNDLISVLEKTYEGEIRIIFSPPPTNQREYFRIEIINFISGIVWWFVVFSISISLFGFGIRLLLKKVKLSILSKLLIFTFFGTILSTPLPFPAATILIVLLPSVFAIPSIGTDYFVRVFDFAIPSFSVSALLCTALAFKFVGSGRT